jgi:hypothetical protein
MALLFGAFLDSPGQWSLIHKYGQDPTDATLIHKVLRINTTGDGAIVAPFDGILSAKDPSGGQLDPAFAFPFIPNPEVPERIDLYLHTHWSKAISTPQIATRTEPVGGLQGIAFLGVDPASLEGSLAAALDNKVLQGGTFGSPKQGRPLTKLKPFSLTRAQAAQLLATGALNIPVKAGQKLGQIAFDPQGARTLAVAAVSRDGLVDVLATYDFLGDLVDPNARQAMNAFGQKGQTGWPVFPGILFDDLLTKASTAILPYPAVAEFRRRNSVTETGWRQLRDRQKALYLQSLLALVGHAPAGSTATPFAFDTLDWRNPFQLEAVAELHMNFTDPWEGGTSPTDPADPGYRRVDLLNYDGNVATMPAPPPGGPTGDDPNASTVLTFTSDDQTMFKALANIGGATSGVREERNLIELSADLNRASKRYVVTSFDETALTMTIAGRPSFQGGLGGPNTSPWILHRRTNLVLIDAFGGRVSGGAATVTAENIIQLERPVAKVANLFDTIYFESDKGSPSRAYRIVQIDAGKQLFGVVARGETDMSTVHPDFGGATSRWRIPAGVSGSIEPLAEEVGTNDSPTGWSHFDGMMFVVKDGRVHHQARWSSFTCRTNKTTPFLSSVTGNHLFQIKSFRSGQAHLNFAFEVADPKGNADTVADARYYYQPLQKKTGVGKDPDGKGNIRIHHSAFVTDPKGNWSAGCITSPNFANGMRDVMIRLYQEEFQALNGGKEDQDMRRFFGVGEIASMDKIKTNDPHFQAAQWGGPLPGKPPPPPKIKGWLWLIHPDELPIDWNFTG